ncbi:MAG: rhodanese-like domain-containing protein [Desulfobacterales bacterium]
MDMNLPMQPKNQRFHLEGVRHISPREAFEQLNNNAVLLVDVRDKDEYDVERVGLPNVKHYPMTEIVDSLENLPKAVLLITMDTLGERGTKVANLLNRQQFSRVANLDGGIVRWKAENLPVEDILPSACGGCCGCSS